MNPAVLAERSQQIADLRAEMVRDDYSPITDVREVELFVAYSKDSVRGIQSAVKAVIRRTNAVRHALSDISEAANIAAKALTTFRELPKSHISAINAQSHSLVQLDHAPIAEFFYALNAIASTATAILSSLARPSDQAARIVAARKLLERTSASLRRSTSDKGGGWPRPLGLSVPLFDEARLRSQRDAKSKVEKASEEAATLGRELRYTQTVVAGELAAWEEHRASTGRKACITFARRTLVIEKERLQGLIRASRMAGLDFGGSKTKKSPNGLSGMYWQEASHGSLSDSSVS